MTRPVYSNHPFFDPFTINQSINQSHYNITQRHIHFTSLIIIRRLDINLSSLHLRPIQSNTLISIILTHHGNKCKPLTSPIRSSDNTNTSNFTNSRKEFPQILLIHSKIQVSNIEFSISHEIWFTSCLYVSFYANLVSIGEGDEFVPVVECEEAVGGLEP